MSRVIVALSANFVSLETMREERTGTRSAVLSFEIGADRRIHDVAIPAGELDELLHQLHRARALLEDDRSAA